MAKVFAGIDFHKNTSTICALYQNGDLAEKLTTIRTDRLVQYLSNRKDWVIAIESAGGVNHMTQKLRDDGHQVVIINSNKFRGIGIGGKKTDARDARALADALRLGFVPEVHLKSPHSRKIKSLIVCREFAVRERVSMVNHIRGTLREYGQSIPVGIEHFWRHAREKILNVDCPMLQEMLMDYFEKALSLKSQEERAFELLKQLTANDERITRLKTVPGVGDMTAFMLICLADDINRFSDSRQFASYLGLVPRVHASAETRMMGSITRSGSELCRRYLIHGARAWMKYSSDSNRDRSWAEKVKSRRGMNKATVALAHRMARICFAILRDGSTYKSNTKVANMAA